MSLRDLLAPDVVAVVGASQTEGKIGYEAAANLRDFDGTVHPVNPNASGELFGRSFVPSVGDLDDCDLALLCVPAPVVADVLEECGEAGVGAAVIYAGGFSETGQEGAELESRIVEVASSYDVTVLGPNTSGFIMPSTGLYASFVGHVDRVEPGEVAVVAQSGGIAHSISFQALNEGLGLSAVVGLGNRATTDFAPVVEYLDESTDTGAILLHIEGTERARELMEVCDAATTPIVAYPVGQDNVGSFAASHTGALTDDYDIYRGGFRQVGVRVVDSLTALRDAGRTLAACPSPSGRNVGIVTAQAGPGIVIVDRLKRAGARLPPLSETTQDELDDLLPGITYEQNPVDTGRPMPEFGDVVAAVARDAGIDIVLVYELFEESIGYPVEELSELTSDLETPIVFATDGPDPETAEGMAALDAAGVPVVRTPERGAEAVAALLDFAGTAEQADVARGGGRHG